MSDKKNTEVTIELIAETCKRCNAPLFRSRASTHSTITGELLQEKLIEYTGSRAILNDICPKCATNDDATEAGFGSIKELYASPAMVGQVTF